MPHSWTYKKPRKLVVGPCGRSSRDTVNLGGRGASHSESLLCHRILLHDAINETVTLKNQCKLFPIVQSAPVLLGFLHELEHHAQRCQTCAAALGLFRSQPHRGEHALDDVGTPDVLPVCRGHFVETEQRLLLALQTRDGLWIFFVKRVDEQPVGLHGRRLILCHLDVADHALCPSMQACKIRGERSDGGGERGRGKRGEGDSHIVYMWIGRK